MIYLDSGATTLQKPPAVAQQVQSAMRSCATPGRGGHAPAMRAAEAVYGCRVLAGQLFDAPPEQVVFTMNATHALNLAIKTLVRPGDRVVISGLEHNAVTRPLYHTGAEIVVAGTRLFDPEDTIESFRKAVTADTKAVVCTHVSNVFGYILPVEEMAALCREQGVPFILDAAQSAGTLPVKLNALGAEFIAAPGHKGLLGPQGTGLLLCRGEAAPLLFGGTGSESIRKDMPDMLPERLEAGTVNVPGAAGLDAGMRYVLSRGSRIGAAEHRQTRRCARMLEKLGVLAFYGAHQAGTISFVPREDCEAFAQRLADRGIAVRAGLHCAPLAHESAGTLETGTVRVSFGPDAADWQTDALINAVGNM